MTTGLTSFDQRFDFCMNCTLCSEQTLAKDFHYYQKQCSWSGGGCIHDILNSVTFCTARKYQTFRYLQIHNIMSRLIIDVKHIQNYNFWSLFWESGQICWLCLSGVLWWKLHAHIFITWEKSIPNLQKAKQISKESKLKICQTFKKRRVDCFLSWIGFTPWIPNLNMDGYRRYPTWIPTNPPTNPR